MARKQAGRPAAPCRDTAGTPQRYAITPAVTAHAAPCAVTGRVGVVDNAAGTTPLCTCAYRGRAVASIRRRSRTASHMHAYRTDHTGTGRHAASNTPSQIDRRPRQGDHSRHNRAPAASIRKLSDKLDSFHAMRPNRTASDPIVTDGYRIKTCLHLTRCIVDLSVSFSDQKNKKIGDRYRKKIFFYPSLLFRNGISNSVLGRSEIGKGASSSARLIAEGFAVVTSYKQRTASPDHGRSHVANWILADWRLELPG